MIDIFNNSTFLSIVGIATPVICLILTFVFRKTEPSKDVKRWISVGLIVLTMAVAIISSGIFKQWVTVWDWISGIVAVLLYYKIVYEFVIKMLPESWRTDPLIAKK